MKMQENHEGKRKYYVVYNLVMKKINFGINKFMLENEVL
jgi:hypothetical protein